MHLNGAKLKVDNFQKYVELYVGPKLGGAPRIFEKCGERWEVCVAASDDGFQQVSFVNSIATSSKEGGTHVKHVTDQVIAKVRETLKKKHKATEKVVKDNQIQSYARTRPGHGASYAQRHSSPPAPPSATGTSRSSSTA